MTRAKIGVVLWIGLPGCALLSRGQPLAIRYFDPEPATSLAPASPWPGCELTLGRVGRAESLREEIEFRKSSYESGYYEARRWTETPDRYLRRALERVLFEEDRCRRVLSGPGVTLDVSLVSFDELRHPEAARVAVQVLLHDEARVLYESTLASTRPAAGDRFEDVARAMGGALADVVAEIADRVETALSAQAGAAEPAGDPPRPGR